MNRIYQSAWNDKTGTFVAVSEINTSAGRKSSPGTSARAATVAGNARFTLKALAVSVMVAFGANAYALPMGGVVAQGGASISSTAVSTTITQSSQNVAINWQSFSIGATEAVQFLQPNSSSVALNRVLGADPSSILGSMSANGKVFLLNPNGILFGRGSQVNVGGLVASTLNMTDSDFMAGNYRFSGSSDAAVVNQGTINAPGGYVALLGANVGNDGIIQARLGTVALAAGSAMTLDVAGDGLLNVTVSQGAVNALVQNGGLIQADGGNVLLTAMAAGVLLQSAVNNTGVIQAQTIENHNGTIRLMGDMQSGTMNISGTLDASGTGAGQTGGSITITGHHVGLFAADINASGDTGGGTVLVGGGYQGNNPEVQNASATYMSADSSINVDAISNGNGGTAVLWANDSTRAYGTITARGGALGGNGGLIETSAHWLDVEGIKINASAPNGERGLWLLDPADVTIGLLSDAGATNTANVFSPNSSVNSTTIGVLVLRAALEGGTGTDVTITTINTGAPGAPPSGLGNITIASALTWTPTDFATLTLSAGGDVNIDAAVSITRGNLVVCCGQDVNVRAPITIDSAAGVGGAAGGSVLLSAGRDVNITRAPIVSPGAAITVTNGNIELCAGRDVILSNTVNPGLAPLITLTNGTIHPNLSLANLGVPLGLTLRAGGAATGPGSAGGTVNFINGGLAGTFITTTTGGPGTPIQIFYNPINYAAPTAYSLNFTGTGGPVTNFMLVYPDVLPKVDNGTTTATLAGFKSTVISGPVPGGITLVPGLLAAADFPAPPVAGAGQTVIYRDFSVGGFVATPGDAAFNFALPTTTCCGPREGATTGTILAAIPVIPPAPPVVPILPGEAEIFAPEEMMGPEAFMAVATILPSLMPRIELAGLPPQLLSIAPVRVPVVVPPPPPPVIEEVPIYVPPVRPLKQDRN